MDIVKVYIFTVVLQDRTTMTKVYPQNMPTSLGSRIDEILSIGGVSSMDITLGQLDRKDLENYG